MFKRMLPDRVVGSVYDIDLHELKLRGVRGIMTDLDNTLVSSRTPDATPELIVWLEGVRKSGLQVVILSNNNHNRVSRFAEPLGIPYIPFARKPLGMSFRRALRLMDLVPHEAAIVGDQLLTDMLGGRRAGLYTILVDPIAPHDEGWTTHINRRIEKFALWRLRRQGLWPLREGGSDDAREQNSSQGR